MLNINIKDIGKSTANTNSGTQSFSRLILPLSGEQQQLKKIPLIGYVENPTLYQHCDMCNDEHPHYQVKNAQGVFATCTKCGNGYKISL